MITELIFLSFLSVLVKAILWLLSKFWGKSGNEPIHFKNFQVKRIAIPIFPFSLRMFLPFVQNSHCLFLLLSPHMVPHPLHESGRGGRMLFSMCFWAAAGTSVVLLDISNCLILLLVSWV